MRNPYIGAIERRMNDLRAQETETYSDEGGRTQVTKKGEWLGSPYEYKLLSGLLKEFKKIDKNFSLPVVSKLRKVADQCEAGGHRSRARMFRALAREFEVKFT